MIREFIPNVSNKLSSDKSFQVILTNYNQRIIWNKSFKLLSKNHRKQYTYTTVIWEIIPNKSYQVMQEKSLQTVLTNYYHRNHWKQYLQTITKEIIPNYAHKSLWDNSIHFK